MTAPRLHAPAVSGRLTHYWLGIQNVNNVWRWNDGTNTTGYVISTQPYARWYHGFAAQWEKGSFCTFAHGSLMYST